MNTTAPTAAQALPTGPTFAVDSEATRAELDAHLALVTKVMAATERGLIPSDEVPHLRGNQAGKDVGDTVVVVASAQFRYGVVSHVTRTGALVVTYSTPSALTRARREWNRDTTVGRNPGRVHQAALNAARRAVQEVAKRQRIVDTDLAELVRGVPGHDSEDAVARDRAARAARNAVDKAQRWLDTHPDHVQVAYDRAYMDAMKRMHVAIHSATPWGSLLRLSQVRIAPVPERPAPDTAHVHHVGYTNAAGHSGTVLIERGTDLRAQALDVAVSIRETGGTVYEVVRVAPDGQRITVPLSEVDEVQRRREVPTEARSVPAASADDETPALVAVPVPAELTPGAPGGLARERGDHDGLLITLTRTANPDAPGDL